MIFFKKKQQHVRSRAYKRAVGLGAISGMRSLASLALLSYDAAYRNGPDLQGTPFAALKTPHAAGTIEALAAAELVGDKLPMTPNRISPLPLMTRAILGAVVGAAACMAEDESPATGAAIGMVAAVLAAFGAFYVRRQIGRSAHVPDPLLGLAEDAVVIGTGLCLLSECQR